MGRMLLGLTSFSSASARVNKYMGLTEKDVE